MSDEQLTQQFKLCQQWDDPEQWELLAMAYYHRGYLLNASRCFQNADACKQTQPAANLAVA